MKKQHNVVAIIAGVVALVAVIYLAVDPFSPEQPETGAAEIYTCPMHPSVQSDRPGACPVCGMALVRKSAGVVIPENLSTITLSQTQRLVANISTVPVRRGEIRNDLRVVGLVTIAEPLQAAVAARFRGRIETVHADFTGKRVQEGDPLFELYSPDLISAQREFLLALRNQESGGILSSSGMSRDLLASSRERLKVHFGLTAGQISVLEQTGEVQNTATFHSPISGTVLRKTVVEGQYVEEGMTLYELADLSSVWISFDVYEKDLIFAGKGQEMTIMSEAFPGETFKGEVTFVEPVLNPETRTVRIRTEAANPAGKLKPNMYVTGRVRKTKPGVLVVPAGAVLSTGNRTLVWVEVAENAFEPREVVSGMANDTEVEVISGVKEGEMIASTGGFLIDSESILRDPSAGDGHQGHTGMTDDQAHPSVTMSGGDVQIRVAGGYSPNVVHLRKGVPVNLHFLREESSKCTEEVVLRDFGQRAFLPQGTPVTLTITPGETGEFVFSCGMNMIHGKIVVHE